MNRANCDKSMKFGGKRHFAMLKKMRVGPILKIVPIPIFRRGFSCPVPIGRNNFISILWKKVLKRNLAEIDSLMN